MASVSAIIAADGVLRQSATGAGVLAVQLALSQVGYKVGIDGDFGPQTEHSVAMLQSQHGLAADGVVGALTAALLDAPHAQLLATAKPVLNSKYTEVSEGYTTPTTITTPHDDTASLLAFFGRPWEDGTLLVSVVPPFLMLYDSKPVASIHVHREIEAPLQRALLRVWDAAKQDEHSPLLFHLRCFDGCFNYRPVRNSSRLSCHAFGAALDFAAATLPMGKRVAASSMPQEVVDAFKAEGFFWGGDFRGRPDPMHFQFAHE